MSKIKLVIFDCDGVLVDSEPVTDRLISDNLTGCGLAVTPAKVHSLFVGGTMKSVGELATKMGAVLPENWLEDIYETLFVALGNGVPVFDGVFDLLDKIDAKGLHKAIASNGPMQKMATTLTPSGLLQRFDGVTYSGHDYPPKPKPDMLIHAMNVAGVSREETVFIDDSAAGCSAARNAGVRCFGFAPEGDTSRLESVGAEPVRSMAEIAKRIGL